MTEHHEQSHGTMHTAPSRGSTPPVNDRFRLAMSATWHCLLGCGLGEIAGMVIGTALGLSNVATIILAIVLGFVFGFALGVVPLLRADFTLRSAFRQILVAEGISIGVMETVEVLVQVNTPGVMDAHLADALFWSGMSAGLAAGFVAAFPVNYWLVAKGVRHKH